MQANLLRTPGIILACVILILSVWGFAVQLPVLTTTPAALPTESVYLEQAGSVVIEAEQFAEQLPGSEAAATHIWEITTTYDDAVGEAIAVLPNEGINTRLETGGPQLRYPIMFQTPGDYYVYVRGYASPVWHENDSLHVGLNGVAVTTNGGTGLTGFRDRSFNWQHPHNHTATRITVPAPGSYNFDLWMREDGLVVDRIWLSLASDAVATGSTLRGPPESPHGSVTTAMSTTMPVATSTPEPPVATSTPEPPVAAPAAAVAPVPDISASHVFRETFDGDPAAPQPWRPANWDVTVHSRDRDTWEALEPMEAAHGPDCSPPPVAHRITAYADAVFLCKNHMMTAINASGYGLIYLTPDHMVDFSQGEAVIRFDLSTLVTSKRDWWDVWITPFDDHLQLALEKEFPDLNGPPRRAVQIGLTPEMVLRAKIYADFAITQESTFHGDIPTQWSVGYDSFLTPDARRRDTFEIRLSRDHLKVGMPDYNFWWIDSPIEPLDWDQGVVQFGHHSYTPTKDCASCTPNTWHWDNIEIAPAIPFTIYRADRRYVDAETAPGVTFAAPAPSNAHLRFAGIGKNLEVSFDGGVSWQPAQVQAQSRSQEDHFKSHWMPVPAGVTEVQFRGEPWYGGGWHVRDISIWSRNARTP